MTVVAGPPARITLVGRIDDSAGLGPIIATLPPGPVVIDTAGVTFVNSIGMRDWIRFLRALREPTHDHGIPTLENVADVLMTQMNLLAEVRGTLRIASFHAQYVCNTCGREDIPVIDAIAHAAQLADLIAPPSPCPECRSAMELADFPERYLSIFRP